MASESSEEGVSVPVPSDLEEWLDRKAATLGVDRETVVVQLLAAYRASEELEDDPDVIVASEDVESRVRGIVSGQIPDIAEAVAEYLDGVDPNGSGQDGDAVDASAVEERLAAELDDLESDLAGEIERVESDFAAKLEDVRERVVQVKRETDAKAPADHSHDELDGLAKAVADLKARIGDLADDLVDVEEATGAHGDDLAALAERLDDVDERLDALDDAVDRLDEVEDRLTTVAWVVSDLREDVSARTAGTEAVDRLKRTAAALDVDRAVCENCGTAVEIALLPTPQCPHCETAVSDVEPAGGFFGKPTLTVARQLEAGADEERANVPDAADRRRDG